MVDASQNLTGYFLRSLPAWRAPALKIQRKHSGRQVGGNFAISAVKYSCDTIQGFKITISFCRRFLLIKIKSLYIRF
jgi:hypothetical protein